MHTAKALETTARLKLNWTTTLVMLLLHAGAVAALFVFSWQRALVALVLYWITICVGISMGYHRLHTHRSYKIPIGLEYFFAICGSLTLEGGPISWVATHRIHHQNADRPGDPHSPRDGVWWSHAGWLISGPANHNDTKKMSKYAPDLAKHPFYLWLNTFHWVPLTALAVGLYAFGGIPMVLWGVCVRIVAGLHATWLVNSATHLWGGRRFDIRDDSRNNWWVALISFGEGWHNNHHAHPKSARHGLAWYELDLSYLLIRLLKRLGIASSVYVVNTAGESDRQTLKAA